MKLKASSVLILAAMSALVGTGCTTAFVQQSADEVASVDQVVTQATEHLRRGERVAVSQNRAVRVHQEAWLPARKVSIPSMQAGFEEGQRQITVNREFTSIKDVAERVTLLTGIPVTVASDAMGNENGAVDDANGEDAFMNLSLSSFLGTSIAYNGTLAGFLDVASSRFNTYWKWEKDGQRIRFFKTDTRTFRIVSLPGDTTLSSRVGNSTESESGGASRQSTEVGFDGLSVWSSIENAVTTMLSPSGRLSISPATGTLTVTDVPTVLESVENLINEQNAALGRQVVVNVKVLSVDLSRNADYGINWDSVYRSLGRLGIEFATGFSGSDSGNMAFRILDTSNSRWAGSSAMISALSTQGKVAQVTSAAVTTLNNQPVPVQVGRQISYLASSETTEEDGQRRTSLTPGVVPVGFSMNLVPHILDGESLLLQYSIDLSSLLNMDKIEANGSMIQTPEVELRNFMQRMRLRSGDTLVVAGFEQTNTDSNLSGFGSFRNPLFGGSQRANNARNALVILIQPVVLDH